MGGGRLFYFFPHPCPLALTVNKSPAVYIFYSLCTDPPPLSNNRRSGSSSKFLLRWGLGGGGLCTGYIFYHRRALDGLWREKRGSVKRLQIIVEKNGKLNLYWAATFIKQSRPPLCRSNNSFSIVVNSIKRPSSTWRPKFSFILRIWWRQSEIEGDDRLWTSNAAPVACSF